MLRGDHFLPVFPLPGVVLYPRVVLPLHIFEERYRTMLAKVLDSHGLIVMALAEPQGDADDEASWRIAPIVGVGKIATYRKNEDGTSDVILLGEARARLTELTESLPYRTGRVSILKEQKPRSRVLQDRLKKELSSHLQTILSRSALTPEQGKLTEAFARDSDVGFLADFLAFRFLKDARERQTLLEELSVEKRVEQLRDYLGTRGLI